MIASFLQGMYVSVYNKNMMKSVRIFLGLIVLCGLFMATPVSAEGGTDFRFFNETGHNLQGEFLKYYDNLANPTAVLGYPITEQFEKNGVLLQYFQRGRLELVGGTVRPTNLGQLTYKPGVKLNFKNSMACETYGGYAVCFAFLEFFKANGGVAYFGNPISGFEFQDNAIVQYFENARLEWHASNAEGNRVVVTHLGSTYFTLANEDSALLDPVDPINNTTKPEVLSLNVLAFPWKAVTYSTDTQLIFVVVQDQTSQPVEKAQVSAVVTWTDGSVQTLPMLLTGDSGIATLPLPVTDQTYGGLVTVDVDVVHGTLAGHTETSFRIWY